MSDMGDIFRDLKEDLRIKKAKWGIDCPGCKRKQPKRIPTRLMPYQRCKVCGFIAPSWEGK